MVRTTLREYNREIENLIESGQNEEAIAPSRHILQDFPQHLAQEYEPALELEEMLLTRRPEEIFAAEDETDWQEWVHFFSQTRETDGRRKGLVEIRL